MYAVEVEAVDVCLFVGSCNCLAYALQGRPSAWLESCHEHEEPELENNYEQLLHAVQYTFTRDYI